MSTINSSNVTIEVAQKDDWLAISKLDRTQWSSNRNSHFIPDGEHVWRLWVEYATVVVARSECQEIIGVAVAFPTVNPHLHYLHKLIIIRESRGMKLGQRIMQKLNDLADENGWSLRLSTDTNNIAMHRLCETLGFGDAVFTPGYYRPNEDRLIYTRQPHT